VAREFLKQVYIRESLAPPKSVSEVQTAYKSLWEQASNAQWWKTTLENGQWKKVGIYALEAYGIFHIGEIVGRRSIVGYNLK
jgi:F-type H+-transporting ATPase subunit g